MYKRQDEAGARAKGKVGSVERSNEMLRSVLDDGFAKGDINCKADCKMYLSFAMQRRNFIQGPGRLAYIQLWSGQMVGTCLFYTSPIPQDSTISRLALSA